MQNNTCKGLYRTSTGLCKGVCRGHVAGTVCRDDIGFRDTILNNGE